MPLIDQTFISFRYPAEIENFLNILRDKTVLQNSESAKFDELYGILPPTQTSWRKNSSCDAQWGLEGRMTVINAWNDFAADMWYSGTHWYCYEVKIFGQPHTAELEPFLNRDSYQEIFALSNEVLEFLSAGFSNQLLKCTAIRKYIAEQQGKTTSMTKRDLISEIFITLLNLKLHEREHFDQDLFIRRAERTVYHIISERAKYFTSPDCRELAKACASLGACKMADELYIPINLVWGFLVNEPFLRKGRKPDAVSYYFLEHYYPNDKVKISPVYPASQRDRTGVTFRQTHDTYKQIFPDYDTALAFRQTAISILDASQCRIADPDPNDSQDKPQPLTGVKKWLKLIFKR